MQLQQYLIIKMHKTGATRNVEHLEVTTSFNLNSRKYSKINKKIPSHSLEAI